MVHDRDEGWILYEETLPTASTYSKEKYPVNGTFVLLKNGNQCSQRIASDLLGVYDGLKLVCGTTTYTFELIPNENYNEVKGKQVPYQAEQDSYYK